MFSQVYLEGHANILMLPMQVPGSSNECYGGEKHERLAENGSLMFPLSSSVPSTSSSLPRCSSGLVLSQDLG